MKETKSRFKSEAKWATALLYGVPAFGPLATLALFLVKLPLLPAGD